MVNRMQTTLNISDVTMRKVKREAARRGQTMSELVEAALRTVIEPELRQADVPPITASLRGIMKGHQVSEDDYKKYLQEKHS